jgi:ribosomal protein S18 acetylase RimI-like enzyme
MRGIETRVADRSDAGEAAELLARAFHADPAMSWILPDERSRNRGLRRYFLTELRNESLRHGAVELAYTNGRMAGVAAWFPPGTWSPDMQAGALLGYIRAFGPRIALGGQLMSASVSVHPREQPHWYLAIIGVDPALKGQGVGAALLRSRLERCDAEGTAAYLESSNVENVPLYEHFGFQVTGALDLPTGAPVVNTMWRPKQS